MNYSVDYLLMTTKGNIAKTVGISDVPKFDSDLELTRYFTQLIAQHEKVTPKYIRVVMWR